MTYLYQYKFCYCYRVFQNPCNIVLDIRTQCLPYMEHQELWTFYIRKVLSSEATLQNPVQVVLSTAVILPPRWQHPSQEGPDTLCALAQVHQTPAAATGTIPTPQGAAQHQPVHTDPGQTNRFGLSCIYASSSIEYSTNGHWINPLDLPKLCVCICSLYMLLSWSSISSAVSCSFHSTATQLFKLLHKYRPETRVERKERLKSIAQKKSEGQEVTQGKKPVVLKYGINHVTNLVEQKKAQLVVIAHDVDPIEVLGLYQPMRGWPWEPAILQNMYRDTVASFPGHSHLQSLIAAYADMEAEELGDLVTDLGRQKVEARHMGRCLTLIIPVSCLPIHGTVNNEWCWCCLANTLVSSLE